MSIWLEIRCDQPLHRRSKWCLNNTGGPGGNAAVDSPVSVLAGRLLQTAKSEGWSQTVNGSVCPACKQENE